jgi:hypothetical protein
MKITYWVAKRLDSSSSIRGKTRKAVEDKVRELGHASYAEPEMVTTPEFTGSFDMLVQCLGGRRIWWEDDTTV